MIYQRALVKGGFMINLAVIFGGESFEHDISVITGVQLLSHANMADYNVIPIYIDKYGKWFTGDELFDLDNFANGFQKLKEVVLTPKSNMLYEVRKKKLKNLINLDVAILCLHGGYGEGGGISALLDMAQIPHSACDMASSSLCLDKIKFKYAMLGLYINTIDFVTVSSDEYVLNRNKVLEGIRKLGYPVILKPARLGSSIGIEVAKDEKTLDEKIKKVFGFDDKVLIEKFADIAKEVNVAIIEDKGELVFSNTEEPVRNSEILSFDEKYRKNPGGFETIKRICPADIDLNQLDEIKSVASKVYKMLGLFGVVRFDFIIDKNGNIFINEVNTIPGSMANYLFDKITMPYGKLIRILVSNAIDRYVKVAERTLQYNSDILKSGVKLLEK